MTQAAQSHREQYSTLGEVNARLKMLGFSQIGSQQAKSILGNVPRHRLVTALTQAHVNDGARRFLETLIPSAQHAPQTNEQNGQQQPAQSNANHQGGQSMPPRSNAPSQPSQPGPANNSPPAQGQQTQSRPPQSNRGYAEGGNQSRNPPPQTGRAGRNDEREFISHHVYGGKAALCWDVDQTKNGDPTIRLEAARSVGERKFDWASKITIQLTRDELPCVAAVFLGILGSTEGRNHGVGDQQGKGFEIQHQGNKLFVKVFAPNQSPCAVPVSPEDAFTVASLLVRQIRKGKPWLSGNDIMTMLRAIIGRMKTQ